MKKIKITPRIITIGVIFILALFYTVIYLVILKSRNNILNSIVENNKSAIVTNNSFDSNILGRGKIIDNVFSLETGNMPENTDIYKKDGVFELDRGVVLKQGENIIFFSNNSFVKDILNLCRKIFIYSLFFGLVFAWLVFILYKNFKKTTELLEESIEKRVTPSDSKTNMKGFSGIFQNISSLYEELAQTEGEVKRKSKLESLGVMLSKILHDLNNVISTLKIYHYIMNNTNDELKKQECLDKINNSLENMTEMVSETFSFIRGDSKKLVSNLRVKDLSNGLIAEYSEKAKLENINYSVNVAEGLENQLLSVNAMKIMAALRNLVQNAFEELDKCENQDNFIKIRFTRFINDLKIEIEDNGRGLPVNVVEKLFTLFVTEGKEEGTGLGIPIAKEYIEDDGGKIDVDTSKKGTIFKINLPLVINEDNNLTI